MSRKRAIDGPELSRPVRVAELATTPRLEIAIVASPDERAALADRFRLEAVDRLEAEATVAADPSGDVVVSGRLDADIVQRCVVTLEPVPEAVAGPFEQRYTRRPEPLADDLVIGPGYDEPPEPIVGEAIDVGELVAQYLSLLMNPYPRADDATFEPLADSPAGGPFAALEQLTRRK